jgi:hypothetical protein
MKSKFNNKNGSLTRYALACGYLEQKIKEDNRVSLGLDGVYHVKGMINGTRVWECFDKLTDARSFYKSITV